MSDIVPITVAKGDGIGPEIMQATLDILKAAGAPYKGLLESTYFYPDGQGI